MNIILFVLIIGLGPFQDASTGNATGLPGNDREIKAAIDLIIQESVEATKSQPKTKIENSIPAFNISIPSIVAGYQQFGQPLRVGAAGVRKWESDEPVTVGDLVHIGSCTKAMTATLVGRLIDQKKLTFETTLKEGLPHLADKIHKDYHDITLLQLMTHRAGVPRDAFWSGYQDKEITERRNLIVAKALAKKAPKPIDNSYAYSNLGYCLVGMIAARTANTSWEEMIQSEIFDVLGMDSAGFGPPGTDGKVDQPWGHLPVGKKLLARQGDNPPPLGPAGTVHLSIADWAKFGLAQAGCSEPKIVSDETLAKLHEVVKKNDDDPNEYACGWIVTQRPWAQGTALLHNGTNTMWYATIWVAPKTKTVYMTAINAGLNTVILTAADRCIGDLIGIHRKTFMQDNR